MPRKHDERYSHVAVAGRSFKCGCPVIATRTAEHGHPQCIGTIAKGESYVYFRDLNPAHWTDKRFCMPCAKASGAASNVLSPTPHASHLLSSAQRSFTGEAVTASPV